MLEKDDDIEKAEKNIEEPETTVSAEETVSGAKKSSSKAAKAKADDAITEVVAEAAEDVVPVEPAVVQFEEMEAPKEIQEVQEDIPEAAFENTQSFDTPVNEDYVDPAANSYEPVTVRPVEFAQFSADSQVSGEENRNLNILMDIKLQMTVELGRCELPIKKVLELTRGSIIELDKIAGEPVELYANGKHIANGEVVVIEDNFGLRITNITDPEERLKNL